MSERSPTTVRLSQEFAEMLRQVGGERSGALIALAIIGAKELGLSMYGIGHDVGLALASPLREPARRNLLLAYYGTATNQHDPPLPAPPRSEYTGDNDEPPPLEFNF